MKQNEDVAKQLFIGLAQCDIRVKADVIKRVSDWLESGGEFNDPYIQSQLRYIEVHLNCLTPEQKFDNKFILC